MICNVGEYLYRHYLTVKHRGSILRIHIISVLLLSLLFPSVTAEVYTIYVVDYAFETPDGSTDIQVSVGDTIIFQWNSTESHNVAQIENEGDDNRLEGGFYSGDPTSGNYSWTLPPEYTNSDISLFYICEPHYTMDSMRGKIIVGGGSPEPEEEQSSTIPFLSLPSTLVLFGIISCLRRQHSN